jgi:hypothetical protein
MTLLAFRSLALVFLVISAGWAQAVSNASDRAILFLVSVHSGQHLKEKEWLSDDLRLSENFRGHGGLSRLTSQSTALAQKYGGIGQIQLLSSDCSGAKCKIRLQLKFRDEERRKASASPAEREDMVWEFSATKSKRNWLFEF